MSKTLLDRLGRHTRLAGGNQVAMLMFNLGDEQVFAI